MVRCENKEQRTGPQVYMAAGFCAWESRQLVRIAESHGAMFDVSLTAYSLKSALHERSFPVGFKSALHGKVVSGRSTVPGAAAMHALAAHQIRRKGMILRHESMWGGYLGTRAARRYLQSQIVFHPRVLTSAREHMRLPGELRVVMHVRLDDFSEFKEGPTPGQWLTMMSMLVIGQVVFAVAYDLNVEQGIIAGMAILAIQRARADARARELVS
jgi:hypothetical protein